MNQFLSFGDLVNDWPVVNGFSVSPGTPWCAAGNRVAIHDSAHLFSDFGDVATDLERGLLQIGDCVMIEQYVSVSTRARVGDQVALHEYATVLREARLANGVDVASEVSVPEGADLGENVQVRGFGKIPNGIEVPANHELIVTAIGCTMVATADAEAEAPR